MCVHVCVHAYVYNTRALKYYVNIETKENICLLCPIAIVT